MSTIKAAELKRHLSFLASDELGGRYALSQSARITARYLASELESYGYRGAAGKGNFLQDVPMAIRKIDKPKSSVNLYPGSSRQPFKYGDDFVVRMPDQCNVKAEMVFAGHGISSPRCEYDDYAAIDARKKIVVIAGGVPPQLDRVYIKESEQGMEAAREHGAVAVIIVARPDGAIDWPVASMFYSTEQITLKSCSPGRNTCIPQIIAGPTMTKALAAMLGKDTSYLLAPENMKLDSRMMNMEGDISLAVETHSPLPTYNVAGILDGSDPALKDEYIVISAHYDHLKTTPKGEVYHGADDNGSGVSSVLTIARAFSAGPRCKRSVLIIFHTGEELGLLGSEYNTDYSPVVPLGEMITDLNVDMIGRTRLKGDDDPLDAKLTDAGSVYLIGADKLSKELNRISEETNSLTTHMRIDYSYNDESDPERFYYRSDHYNYARHGIPVIFYFSGVHKDYHKTTDNPDKIDYDKMARISRLVFATGWRLANLDHRLVVGK